MLTIIYLKVIKNGEVLFEGNEDPSKYLGVFIDRSILNVNDIFEFANTVDIKHIKELLDMQINYNIAIAKEGIKWRVWSRDRQNAYEVLSKFNYY